MCLPDEDQKGVAVLRSRAPPAGQTLRRSSRHTVNRQHALHGTDRGGNHRVPPLTSLCAISPRKGCLFRAAAAGGTLILKFIYIQTFPTMLPVCCRYLNI